MSQARTAAFKMLIGAALITAVTGLSGCSRDDHPSVGQALDSMRGMSQAYEDRLARIATQSLKADNPHEAVIAYQNLYERRKRDGEVALEYAMALRKNGQAETAIDVIKPFMRRKSIAPEVMPELTVEYAASHLELAQMDKARDIANSVLGMDPAKAEGMFPYAHNILGITLDAEGDYLAAEAEYRQALETWPGDPVPVMNNLALCLANQGQFENALTTLRQAQALAPEKEGLARNIEIVTEMRKAAIPLTKKKKK